MSFCLNIKRKEFLKVLQIKPMLQIDITYHTSRLLERINQQQKLELGFMFQQNAMTKNSFTIL